MTILPPPALGNHVAGNGLAAQKRTAQIGGDHALPFGKIQLQKRHDFAHAGAVDQDIEPAKRAHRAVDRRRDRVGPGHIELHGDRFCARVGEGVHAGLSRFEIKVGRSQGRALLAKGQAGRPADTAASPRHQDTGVCKSHMRLLISCSPQAQDLQV